MELNTAPIPSTPLILKNLPDIPLPDNGCPRRTKTQIDLILLAVEALQLGGAEVMLKVVKDLDLQGIIPNRVSLWRLRSTNPLRLNSQRRPLTLNEAKALVIITGHLAKRLTVPIRKLLFDYQQLNQKQLPIENHLQLSFYLEQFRAHFRSRMNPRRSGVMAYNSEEKLNQLGLELLGKLLFCTGTTGMQRFWISLFDGEVS
ncbi:MULTISPECIES: DUF3038 domain-containing protein [Okeania]|uniref:DUF3038 domain-containing protein n=1 Tax=Okeania hirsuta TaxID=1458930 RepID=A0A3N6PSE0_9CYAN|nr:MULTISPECIES: DUF3038 domain-containing protein [Okeania]NES74595.1 DUF3038 domain-containing protein [Okeania sp. SIO1H4]NES87904.1 DUF3038 domain-containing protein [Okeania sp. SIO2B9]NET18667.1 DUF3038 domain-containing protein [Okeania sp. SIO1H5]NET74773.1 DUF3038 domain-containing protein [Okeania sp. SIO1F9]NET92314.1 DUF3038 domain-containing protein [Okeania sp. SIO1H2]